MLWICLSATVGLIFALNSIIDNYIVDVFFRGKTPQALKVFDGFSYLVVATVLLAFFGLQSIPAICILMLLLAGIISSISSIPYMLGLKTEEATSATIYVQLVPVIYAIVDSLFFNEAITNQQLLGFVIILLAPAVIIFSRHHATARKMELRAAVLFIIYAILIVASSIITTHASDDIPGSNQAFSTIFIYFLLGRGISDIALSLFNKKWRKRFRDVCKKSGLKFFLVITINQASYTAAELMSRYAFIIGTAAIASAIENVSELVSVFVLGVVLSAIWPNFGREKLNRHIIIAHLIATILATIGIIIIQ